ncbi:hypothetical protein RD792_008266 [Penstemon davidsonii]|uniref:C-CAP/cofactor C-like domain-containing protein n=1 Tax=Penstemon davidsonii TaxID=160366 RepID=A0ABR0D9Z3_9LAMI|nr:hypothetical protein RD792_008266 [Penstemon davidsonii]
MSYHPTIPPSPKRWSRNAQPCSSAYPTANTPATLKNPSQTLQPHSKIPNPSSLSSPNPSSPLNPTSPKLVTHKPDLEPISLEISTLEKLVAENSYFLPPYEVRACLTTIALLKQSLDDITSKKKFSFKNKTSKKTTTLAQNRPVICKNEEKANVGYEKQGFGFRDRENEVLTKEFNISEPEGQNGEFTLSGLRGCEIRLKGCLRSLFIDRLVSCKVYVGAVMGSVLIEGAEGCVFILGSHQIRIHNAKDCDFYLRVRSRPIIEDSCGVRFAPYCLSYEGLERDLEEANLGEETEIG